MSGQDDCQFIEPSCERGNFQYMQHVGFKNNMVLDALFSPENIKNMSLEITRLLTGVDKHNRPIIVPDETILNVLSSVYDGFRPSTGDIYTRYSMVSPNEDGLAFNNLIKQAISIIVSDVRNNLGFDEVNKNLSIWNTIFGDFNTHQLRSHPPIKLRERRPQPMLFNMNY